ncbi:CHAP domain-containing protein [Rhodospirillum sp. A1_3_36]|uniref:CHAP domain-containing protein n=1 Tax=Rhodospirillum sp. A1_3_36 TaxID=3391666 RepID=UPI0039A4F43B
MTTTALHCCPARPQSGPKSRQWRALALVSLLLVSACGGGRSMTSTPGSMAIPRYSGDESFVWCVPYARAISGVSLRGDADTWWDQAAGRYTRDNRPQLGSVLTLRPDSRLRSGHVAVVTGIDGPRDIRVSHANWGWNDKTRGRIYENMPARDVSPNNDWSQIRFRHPEVNGYGRVYSALGFIHSETRVASVTPDPEDTRFPAQKPLVRPTTPIQPQAVSLRSPQAPSNQQSVNPTRSLQLW